MCHLLILLISAWVRIYLFTACHPSLSHSLSLSILCTILPPLLAEERAVADAAKVAETSESNDSPQKCYLNAKTHTQQEPMRAQEDNGLQKPPMCL